MTVYDIMLHMFIVLVRLSGEVVVSVHVHTSCKEQMSFRKSINIQQSESCSLNESVNFHWSLGVSFPKILMEY